MVRNETPQLLVRRAALSFPAQRHHQTEHRLRVVGIDVRGARIRRARRRDVALSHHDVAANLVQVGVTRARFQRGIHLKMARSRSPLVRSRASFARVGVRKGFKRRASSKQRPASLRSNSSGAVPSKQRVGVFRHLRQHGFEIVYRFLVATIVQRLTPSSGGGGEHGRAKLDGGVKRVRRNWTPIA